MKFTEAQLETAIIELLEVEGYPHVLGEAIERQPLVERLCDALLPNSFPRMYVALTLNNSIRRF